MFKFILSLILMFSVSAANARTIELNENNTIAFRDYIDAMTSTFMIETLNHLDFQRLDKSQPIYVVLDTPGGEIFHGERMVAAASLYENVFFIILKGHSMGGFIPQLLPRTRYMAENGSFLIHEIRTSCGENLVPDQIQECLSELIKDNKSYAKSVSKRSKMTEEAVLKLMKRDVVITANSAKNLGLIDEVVKIKCTDGLKKRRITFRKWTEAGQPPAITRYSGCPLVRGPVND